ncbi:hypothetical protein APHAL10511_005450 [Amanita phalloides]|nr:hypothetical protein APHAL10511_005450 [Amanita phalloides]
MGSNSSKYDSASDSDEESIVPQASSDWKRRYTRPSPGSFMTICYVDLELADITPIRLGNATIGRFRLIDCTEYCDGGIRVIEFESAEVIKRLAYATISYVWKGNHRAEKSKSFNVVVSDEAKSGDRISIKVLRMACKAALHHGVRYIWLDRLCIMQDTFGDLAWQMSIMSDVYRNAAYCFVLPGGIGRLVKLEEETTWIYRSWTLMEALSPREVWCIFRWSRGPGTWHGVKDYMDDVEEIEKGYCAMTRLEAVLALSRTRVNFADEDQEETYFLPSGKSGRHLESINLVLFSSEIEPMTALESARSLQQLAQSIRKKAETQALTTKDLWRLASAETAIWRCAVMRTSQYERDIVYSIMGLFGVNLAYDKNKTRDQLIVELCTQILRNGGNANWFVASISLPVPQIFCTMPPTPVMGGGVPQFRTSNGTSKPAHKFMGMLDWFLEDMPKVKVTEGAVLEFSAPISPVKRGPVPKNSPPPLKFVFTVVKIKSEIDGITRVANLGGNIGTHAVNLGGTLPYAHFGLDAQDHGRTMVLMLLKKRPGGWQKTGMALMGFSKLRWPKQLVRIPSYPSQQIEV